VLVLTIIFASGADRFLGITSGTPDFDTSLELWFVEGDPALKSYRDFLDDFGNDEILFLIIKETNIWNTSLIDVIKEMSAEIERIPYVLRVTSPTSVEIPRAVGSTIYVEPLFLDTSDAGLARARKRILSNPITRENVVTRDESAFIITAHIEHREGVFDHKVELVASFRSLIRKYGKHGRHFVLGGSPYFDVEFFEATMDDLKIAGYMYLVFFIVLLIVFRNVYLAFLPIGIVLISTLILHGLMYELGYKMNNMSTILPSLITAVGTADTVHLIVHWRHLKDKGKDQPERTTFIDLLRVCFLTSLTTSIGFSSMVFSDLKPLRELGMFASLGVFLAFILSMIVVPVVLTYFRSKRTLPGSTALPRSLGATRHHRRKIVIAFSFLAAVAIVGVTFIKVEANTLEYFSRESEAYKSAKMIEKMMGGGGSIQYVIRSDTSIYDPNFISSVDAFSSALTNDPLIVKSTSYLDFIRSVETVLHSGTSGSSGLPRTERAAAEDLMLLRNGSSSDQLAEYISFDETAVRLEARVRWVGSSEYKKLLLRLEKNEKLLIPYTFERTGLVVLLSNMEDYLLESQIMSFILAFVLITVFLGIFLRSVRLAFLSLIPNILPVLLVLGFMGYAGLRLDIASVLVAALSLSIAVDDTVHIFNWWRKYRKEGKSNHEALFLAFEHAGLAILLTTIFLSSGFAMLALGDFAPNVIFGSLVSLAIILALVCDLFVFPAVVFLMEKKNGASP